MKSYKFIAGVVVAAAFAMFAVVGCGTGQKAQSVSGVEVAKVGKIQTDEHGHTVEQQNIIERIQADNDLGAIKHLYIISAYSGQVILYSPVKGKVTSGGKSLTPKNITAINTCDLPYITVGGRVYYTNQLPNEDGTYGSTSTDYVYWKTPAGQYHQHFMSGGQIVHISDKPIAVKSVVINVEADK